MLGQGIEMFNDVCITDRQPSLSTGDESLLPISVQCKYPNVANTLSISDINCKLDQFIIECVYNRDKINYVLTIANESLIYGKEDENSANSTDKPVKKGILTKIWESIKKLAKRIWEFISGIFDKVHKWLFGSNDEITKLTASAQKVQSEISKDPEKVREKVEDALAYKELKDVANKDDSLKTDIDSLDLNMKKVSTKQGLDDLNKTIEDSKKYSWNKQIKDAKVEFDKKIEIFKTKARKTITNVMVRLLGEKGRRIAEIINKCRLLAAKKMKERRYTIIEMNTYKNYVTYLTTALDNLDECRKMINDEFLSFIKKNFAVDKITNNTVKNFHAKVESFEKLVNKVGSKMDFKTKTEDYTLEDITVNKKLEPYVKFIDSQASQRVDLDKKFVAFMKLSEEINEAVSKVKATYFENLNRASNNLLSSDLQKILIYTNRENNEFLKKINQFKTITKHILNVAQMSDLQDLIMPKQYTGE